MSNNDDNIFIKYIANKMCVTMTHTESSEYKYKEVSGIFLRWLRGLEKGSNLCTS